MRAKLTVLRGASKGKKILIAKPQYVVGRSEKCQLRLNHEAISRKHCAFLLSPDKVELRDLGSRNGTLVNGKKIAKQTELKTGDEVQFGPLSFQVQIVDQAGNVVKAKKATSAAEPTAGDSGIISDWLSDADGAEVAAKTNDTTRMFKFDKAETEQEDVSGDETQAIKNSDTKKIGAKKKAKPGKIPADKKQAEVGENSQDAAAETLRRLFTRGN